MGLLKYAALGAVAGGTEKYGELREEERKDKRQLDKESRNEAFKLRAEDRLAKVKSTELAESREYQEGKDFDKRAMTSEQARLDRDFKAEQAALDREARKKGKAKPVKDRAIMLKTGGTQIYSELEKRYKVTNMEQNAYGEEVLKEGAPDFEDWYNSMVAPQEQISSGLTPKKEEEPKELTPEEIAAGRESFNIKSGGKSKAEDYIPFNEASDEQARQEALLLRTKKPGLLTQDTKSEQAAPKPAAPETTEPVRIKSTNDYNQLKSGQQYYDPNGVLRVKK